MQVFWYYRVDIMCFHASHVWVQGPTSWRGQYYQYRITVFCPDSQQVQNLITTDPYSLSLAADGTHTQACSAMHADWLFVYPCVSLVLSPAVLAVCACITRSA